MNCQQGDIARIIGIHPAVNDARDRLVQCIEAVVIGGEPGWKLDRRVEFVVAANCTCMGQPFDKGDQCFFDTLQDKYLRPIRDQPGTDEILREVGHPLSKSHREKESA